MGEEKSLLGVVDAVRQLDWTKKSSPVYLTFYIIVGLSGLALALGPMGITLPSPFYIGSFSFMEVIVLIRWGYVRWYRPFDREMLSIGFAFRADPSSKLSYQEILAAFRRDIERHGLQEFIKIRELPSDLKFSSGPEAEDYLIKKGLRVVIWGDTTRAKVKGEDVSIFNVQYSCQHRIFPGEDKGEVLSTIRDGAVRGAWGVSDTDSLQGINVVAGNLFEVSAYVLAVCLWSVREVKYVEKAAVILESVRARLEPRAQDVNFPNLNDFKDRINKLVYGVHAGIVNYYVKKRDFPAAKPWAEKLYRLNPGDYEANMFLAMISWELGDQVAARNYTRAAREARPKESLPCLNLAFFHFYDGRYVKALAYYKGLKPNIVRKTNILDVIDFLEREFDKSQKYAVLFAAAWLSVHYGDSVRGRQMLQDFLQNTKEGVYDKLRDEANKLLAAD